MLATRDLSADRAGALDPEDLFTISAGGFSATADAFARDPDSQGLWFLSMVGSQTALKAIWASLLKQPPEVAHLIKGADGMALSGGYERCSIPYNTIGTWTTKIARLPVSGGWHALVYTKTAEYGFEKDSFLLLAQAEEEAPALHHRFLDKRSPLPLHGSWAGWLWQRGLDNGEIVPLQSVGVSAYRCSPKADKLREDLSDAVASVCRTPIHLSEVILTHQNQDTRTLQTAKRKNKRRQNRNVGTWRRFSPDGTTCRFCEHDGSAHLCVSGQPHFYRRATEEERNDPRLTLYRHDTPEGGSALVRRVVVANHAELITAFCTSCAKAMQTGQVLCYQRTLATGEVVGVRTNNTERR